jgi:hypothetical protein
MESASRPASYAERPAWRVNLLRVLVLTHPIAIIVKRKIGSRDIENA